MNLIWDSGNNETPKAVWPSIEQGNRVAKGATRRLTLVPSRFSEWCVDSKGYHPTTKGDQQLVLNQIAEDIRQHLFRPSEEEGADQQLQDLANACERLESSMERMNAVEWGSALGSLCIALPREGEEREEEDEQRHGRRDERFDHSWTPSGPGPGWYWIPKGRLLLDQVFPARLNDVRRFGHLARKVKGIPPPLPTAAPFARVVREGTMANREMQRQGGKRRQEDWMEEDDLLGGFQERARSEEADTVEAERSGESRSWRL